MWTKLVQKVGNHGGRNTTTLLTSNRIASPTTGRFISSSSSLLSPQSTNTSGAVCDSHVHSKQCSCCAGSASPGYCRRHHHFSSSHQRHVSQGRQVSSISNALHFRNFSTDKDNQKDVSTNNETEITTESSSEGPTDLGLPGAQKGGKKLAIVFTCTVCDTRSAKQFTENSYRHGVVIVQCPGCKNRHLIADNLGIFEDEDGGWNIEKGMAKLGQNVKVVTNEDVLELSVEDVWGDVATRKNNTTSTSTTDDDNSTKKDA